MSGIAIGRLSEERKNWRKDSLPGFYARPEKKSDNSTNLMKWEIGVPGKEGTDWAGGVFKGVFLFSDEYPSKPPKCKFVPPLFHPNVFSDGSICLSILNETQGWSPAITIRQMLLGIQELLDNPNPKSPAQEGAITLYLRNKPEYVKKIKAQTAANIPSF